MENTSVTLRRETPADYRAVELLTRAAFWNHHGPGCDEHYLVHCLRRTDAFIPALDIVAELGGQIVGHILCTKAKIVLDKGGELPVLTFGPLSVLPDVQKQGIGSTLIRHTLALAKAMGFSAVCILGDPAYYSRHGFKAAEDFSIGIDRERYHAALQCYELTQDALSGAQGFFACDPAYDCDPSKSTAYDAAFPKKEKCSGTPSQLRFQQTLAMHKPRLK